MAAITNSASANFDLCTGQTTAATLDTFTQDNGQLLIDTDTKYCSGHVTNTTASNGALDTVTVANTAVDGEIKFNGTNIWHIPYSGGSGTGPVPVPTALVPTAVTWTTEQVQLTFGAGHGYLQGDIIGVGGFLGADIVNGYCGEFEVISVPSTTTLTYQLPGDNPGTATVTNGKVLKKWKVEQTQTRSVSTASISGGIASFTTTANHNLTAGNYVTITGVTSSGTGSFNSNWTISALTWATNTATVTTSANHNLSVDDIVVIASIVQTGTGSLNGIYKILTVPAANQFTYTAVGTTLARTSGGTVNKRYFILSSGLSATTFNVANPSTATYTSGGTITKVALAIWQGQWVSWTDGPWRSATIAASGIIKVKSLFNGSFQAGALTIQGGTTPVATAISNERRSWIEIIGTQMGTTPAVYSIPRLGKFTVTGDWFYPQTFPLPAASVTSMTISTGVVTVSTIPAHGYTVGSFIEVIGAVPVEYNGTYLIQTVPNTTTFTYTPTSTPAGNASTQGSLIAYIGTSGSPNQLVQLPATTTNGTATAGIAPYGGIYIETYYNSGVYEPYPCMANITAAASLVQTDSFRGKVCSMASLGQVRLGGDGTNNWGYIPGSVNIISSSWVGNVSTYATAANHNLVLNQPVTINGCVPTGYNGTYQVASIISATSFTVANAVQPTGSLAPTNIVSSATGLVTVTVGTTGSAIMVGSTITVAGSTVTGHNGTFVVESVIGTAAAITGFTYFAFNTNTTAVTTGVTITSNGLAAAGGLKIRIPNVISFTTTKVVTAGAYLNTVALATQATNGRPYFVTTSAGVISIDKWANNWYPVFDQPYSVSITNTVQCESIRISECATPFVLDNIVTGVSSIAVAAHAWELYLGLCYSGGTISNCTFAKLSLATAGYGIQYWQDTFNVTTTNVKNVAFTITTAGGGAARLTTVGGNTGTFNLTRVSNCTWDNVTMQGMGAYIATCTNLSFTTTHYADNIRASTTATSPQAIFNVQSNSAYITINGIDFGGQLNCHPYNSILNICSSTLGSTGGSNNIKLRNVGTLTTPIFTGGTIVLGMQFLISQGSISKAPVAGAGVNNIEVKRVYLSSINGAGCNSVYNLDNSCSDILLESVFLRATTATFVGSSSTTTLTVASISAGQIMPGQLVYKTTNGTLTYGTFITAFGTGVGGTGTYTLDTSQTISASTELTSSTTLLPSANSGTSPLNVTVKGCQGDANVQPQTATYGFNYSDVFLGNGNYISSASWTTGTATFNTAYAHGLTTGNAVIVSGCIPYQYDGYYIVTTAGPTSTAFTAAITTNPGIYNGSGSISPLTGYVSIVMNEQTSKLTTYSFSRLGKGSGFTSTGLLALLNPYDEIIWTQPYFSIGHTGFPSGTAAKLPRVAYNTAATGNEINHTIFYDIDKGSGFSGTYKNLKFLAARGGANWGISSATLTLTPVTATVSGTINGSVLTVINASAGYLFPGMTITGTGITAGTIITDIIDAPAAHAGTYTVQIITFAGGTYSLSTSTQVVSTITTITASTSSHGIAVGNYAFDITTPANIPAGTTVSSINSATSVTLSGNGTTSSSQTLAFSSLPSETGISESTGFKLKIKAQATALSLTNALTSIAVKTTTTVAAQANQYPLDTVATTITLSNIVVGSRYRIYNTATSALLYEGTAAVAPVVINYTWNSNVTVTIRVRSASVLPKYQPFETQGIITNAGLNAYISQIRDTIIA